MNRYLLCLLFLMSSFGAFSQRVYFIYLQSEQEQPFFVKMDEKIYSSSASGYLIFSKLKDSTYNFSIGFPQSKWPEQKFSVVLRGKDHGYMIKNFGDKGWGLYDLQTLSIQMAATDASKTSAIKTEAKDVSPFTEILARAADDPSLREKPVVAKTEVVKPPEKEIVQEKKEEAKLVVAKTEEVKSPATTITQEKKEEVKPVVTEPPVLAKKEEPKVIIKEPDVIKPGGTSGIVVVNREMEDTPPPKTEQPKTETKTIEGKTEPVTAETRGIVSGTNDQKPEEAEVEYKKTTVTRKFGKTTTEGIGLMFIDEYSDGKKDTIHILIPDAKPVINEIKETPKQEKKFLEIASVTADTMPGVKDPVVKEEVVAESKTVNPVSKPQPKSNCKEVATETDFLKLRRNMAAETDDDDMVDEARKYFKNKCFTTLQLRNLGALFLDDLGKYKFFDLAYLFVSDKENFSSLQSELKNEYYINRFKAMLK
jgi:hypothetical protein